MKQLLNNLVLFKPFPSEEKTQGGIFVPDSVKEINNKGILVKVGTGTKKRPMRLEEGTVAYRVFNWGDEYIINGEKYFLMDESAILSIE